MTSVGDYDLERQIGAGASGTVWKAQHRGPVTRVVALKRLRAGGTAADLARIHREAAVLTELDHPHVVRVLEVLHDGDGLALAMQFAPGGSLQDLLAERSRLTPGQVVAVAAPVADALTSAHRRGVLHGDVKPANILFTSDGEPLLTDFGVARTLGRLTSDLVTGTAEYLAPELAEGAQPDPRADVYSLAVVCYEALAGRPPYTGAVPLAAVRAADRGEHQPLDEMPGVPHPLAVAVEQAMARDPAERFPTAEAFARALRAAVPSGDVTLPGPAGAPGAGGDDGDHGDEPSLTRTFGPRPPRPEPPPAPRLRPRRRVPLYVVIALVAAGLLYLVRSGRDGGPGPEDPDGRPCPEAEVPALDPGARVVTGDPEGDGCPTKGTYQVQQVSGTPQMVLTIDVDGDVKRISIGDIGDQVVLGDWNCDDSDTPGLYRSQAGEVQYYDVWPEVAQQQYEPQSVESVDIGGTASLQEGNGDLCDRIVVTSPPS